MSVEQLKRLSMACLSTPEMGHREGYSVYIQWRMQRRRTGWSMRDLGTWPLGMISKRLGFPTRTGTCSQWIFLLEFLGMPSWVPGLRSFQIAQHYPAVSGKRHKTHLKRAELLRDKLMKSGHLSSVTEIRDSPSLVWIDWGPPSWPEFQNPNSCQNRHAYAKNFGSLAPPPR